MAFPLQYGRPQKQRMNNKILIIGQAPPAVKQTVPYDTTMLYEMFAWVDISKEQAKEELDDLKKLLNPNGVILFTVWRAEIFEPFHKWILERFENVVPIDFSTVQYNKMAYWINTSTVVTDTIDYVSDDINSFNTYYNLEWFKEEIKPALHLGMPVDQHQDLFY